MRNARPPKPGRRRRGLRRLVTAFMLVAGAGWLVRVARRRHVFWAPPASLVRHAGLAVRTTGTHGIPIVLLHGLASSGLVWGHHFEVLGRDHRLIVPDLYGFGDSVTRAPTGFGPEDHVEHVVACLQALGADDEPVVVVGHSMGALIALRLAATHPDRVRAVVGFAAPLYRTPADAAAHIGGIDPLAKMFVLETTTAYRACQWVCEHRTAAGLLSQLLRPDLPGAIARDGVRHTWPSYSESLQRVILAADSRELLERIEAPVHLVAGGADRVCPQKSFDGLDGRHLHREVWPGIDHHVPLLAPKRCVATIRDMIGV